MDLSEFTANYSQLGDDQLLCLWADRNALVPEAAIALDSEIQRRGLKKENAERIKKRFDTLAAREDKGPLGKQVATAKYERNMRHFVGWQEPEFYSPYGNRDIRNTFAYIRHKYRVWKAFRNHTGHWPVFFDLVLFPVLDGCVRLRSSRFCLGRGTQMGHEHLDYRGGCRLCFGTARRSGIGRTPDKKAGLEKIRRVVVGEESPFQSLTAPGAVRSRPSPNFLLL
jgi:hypothetical protein